MKIKHTLQENYERFFGKLYESDWFFIGEKYQLAW